MTIFERYMKDEHSGEQNAVLSKEIEKRFKIKGDFSVKVMCIPSE